MYVGAACLAGVGLHRAVYVMDGVLITQAVTSLRHANTTVNARSFVTGLLLISRIGLSTSGSRNFFQWGSGGRMGRQTLGQAAVSHKV